MIETKDERLLEVVSQYIEDYENIPTVDSNGQVKIPFNMLKSLFEKAEQAERVEELEEELMTAHAPVGHLEQENEQLREALKEIQNLNYSDSASQAIVKARQALEEDNNARD